MTWGLEEEVHFQPDPLFMVGGQMGSAPCAAEPAGNSAAIPIAAALNQSLVALRKNSCSPPMAKLGVAG
jgi:hypothetical protein